MNNLLHNLRDIVRPYPCLHAKFNRALESMISAGEAPPNAREDRLPAAASTEKQIDDASIDAFALDMKLTMAAQRIKGKHGWHDNDRCDAEWLSELFYASVAGGNLVDIANYAMMLHQRDEHLSPPTDPRTALMLATRIIEDKHGAINRVRRNSGDPDQRGYAAEFIYDADIFLTLSKRFLAWQQTASTPAINPYEEKAAC